MLNDSAGEPKRPKYARRERERRFLLAGPPGGSAVSTVAITDRYLSGTRIRLRRATVSASSGERIVYKLTQKVPGSDGGPGFITTMYLTGDEYRVLEQVPAAVLTKTRLKVPPLGVDLFEGALAGLVLAEAEFSDDDELAGFTPPPAVVAEVTTDHRFTGGHLASAGPDAVALALSDYGISMPRAGGTGQPPPLTDEFAELDEPDKQDVVARAEDGVPRDVRTVRGQCP